MDGGQTKLDPSGWTTDTLHTHVQKMLNDRDIMWMELRKTDEQRYEQRFTAQQEAIRKAEASIEARLANTNEWRAAMNDRDLRLLPRLEFDSILKEWTSWRGTEGQEFQKLDNRVTVIETRSVTWTAAIGVLFLIIQIAMFWVSHNWK